MNRRLPIQALAVLILMLICLSTNAAPIDLERAQEIAVQFVNQNIYQRSGKHLAPLRKQQLNLSQGVAPPQNQSAYYVFNIEAGGFVIVSGDDLAVPVLGFSDTGSFDAEHIPESLKALLRNYENQIAFVSTQTDSKARRLNDNWAEIIPLVKTHWGQDEPFNNLCPIDPSDNKRSITGCTAVALAQTLYYYQWPEYGSGRVSYQWRNQTLTADFSKVHFEWDKMKLDYRYDDSDEDDAVATLLYNCALAAHSDFSSSSTGGYFFTQTFHNYFGYKDQIKQLWLDDTTIDDFEATIYHELKNTRLVLFSADGDDGGHAMVIDGFKDGYFHINLGWSGHCDGYYPITAIVTTWYQFNTGQYFLYDIQPDYNPPVIAHFYPESSYELSDDGSQLIKWKGNEEVIDMTADVAFDQVRSIKSHAFSDNTTVTSIVFPDRTETIECKAVENCRELESVFIPMRIDNIEPQAFTNCPYLDQFVVSEAAWDYKSIDGLLVQKNHHVIVASASSLSGDVAMPSDIVGISDYAFADRRISSVDIPDAVTGINEGAFSGCEMLSNVTLRQGLEKIGPKAFKDCEGLKQIVVHATTPPQVEEDAFDGVDCASVYLCVPSESMDQYLHAPGWEKFSTVVAALRPESQKLLIYTRDGAKDSYSLRSKPIIKNTGQELLVSSSYQTKAYRIDQIKKMQFFDEGINTDFALSANSVNLKIGETQNVQIISGRSDYTISNSKPDVVKATLNGEEIVLSAIGVGASIIIVTDNKTKQVAELEVKVTRSTTIKVDPMNINFNLPKGSSGKDYFTVYNTGEGPLTFHLDYSTKNGMLDILEGGEEYVLEPGESKKFTVVFSIPADYDYGGGGIAVYICSDATNKEDYYMLNVGYRVSDGLALSSTSVDMKVGDTQNIKINSGNGDYTISNSHPDVVKATLNGEEIVLSAIGVGVSTITVTDNKTSQVAELEVNVSLPMYAVFKDGTLTFYYDTSKGSREGAIYELNTSDKPGWLSEDIKKVVFDPSFADARPTSTSMWFDFLKNLNTIEGIEHLNTSEVTNMVCMFFYCKELTNLDVSHFNTSKVTNMSGMFAYSSLKNLDLTNFNTSSVVCMDNMFDCCLSLESLNVDHFNTSNVISMNRMFNQCEKLKYLDVHNFDMSKCVNTTSMFHYCKNLKNLYVSPTMDKIDDGACDGIGWTITPCTLIVPDGFNLGVDTSGDFFKWKSGYFKLGSSSISDIYFNLLPPHSRIRIFDVEGRLIRDERLDEIPKSLDLSDLSSGVYLVSINGVTYKIVKK